MEFARTQYMKKLINKKNNGRVKIITVFVVVVSPISYLNCIQNISVKTEYLPIKLFILLWTNSLMQNIEILLNWINMFERELQIRQSNIM